MRQLAHGNWPQGGIALEPVAKREIYAIPHCLTEYGEILLEEGKTEEAKSVFTKARKGFNNYDFDKPLIRKLEKNLDQIKQLQKQEKRAKSSKLLADDVKLSKWTRLLRYAVQFLKSEIWRD